MGFRNLQEKVEKINPFRFLVNLTITRAKIYFFPHLQKIEIDPRPINCWEYDMPTCVSRQLWSFQIHTPYLSELDFSNSPVWNIKFDELDFFPSLKLTGIFFQFNLIFFSSFMARVKYFDGPCLTIYSLSTIYRDIHYQFLVWWIHYSHCYESKR